MSTYAINATTGASTQYTDFGFDSFCRGTDGKYYGIKADGIYLLEGGSDSVVDFGDLNFGTSAEKRIASAYANGTSVEPMELTIVQGENEYTYAARSNDALPNTHRFDVGKGLRANYFGVRLANTEQSDFTLDAIEIAAVQTSRRI